MPFTRLSSCDDIAMDVNLSGRWAAQTISWDTLSLTTSPVSFDAHDHNEQTAHDTVNPPHSNNAWLQLQIQTPAMSGNRWISSHHSHPKGMSGQNVVHLECRLEH